MSDEKIVSAIKNGDEAVLDKVINKYSKLMWKVVSNIMEDATPQDLEECVADVFIYLWKNPDNFDSSKGPLKKWLSLIARSRAINKMKIIYRNCHVSYDDSILVDELAKSEGTFDMEDKILLISAVRALGELDRDILLRKYCKDQSVSQIAEELNISIKNVENRLYRTKNKLRQIFVG